MANLMRLKAISTNEINCVFKIILFHLLALTGISFLLVVRTVTSLSQHPTIILIMMTLILLKAQARVSLRLI